MPGFLWMVLLLTIGALYLGHHAGLDQPRAGKPRLSLKGGRWHVTYRSQTHGPFLTHAAAERAALQLISNTQRTGGAR